MNQPRHQKLLSGFGDEAAADGAGAEKPESVTASPPTEGTACPADDSAESSISLRGRSVWVVDAHSLIYQVFHAMPTMSGPAGQPIGAVHGFIRDIADLLEKHAPDFLICAFDHSDVTFRNEIYDAYKQHREAMPDDLRPQMESIRRMLDAMGVLCLEQPGYEADDLLATLARQVRDAGGTCVLVTSDKDCRQLIGDGVRIFLIRKNAFMDAEELREDWGIRPDQVVDFQSLVGDPVDAVPGVPLIGPKIARELLQKYETLEGVFEHIEEIPGAKRKENLRRYHEQALMSRELVRLRDDVPIVVDWKRAAALSGMDVPRLEALCQEFGFRQLKDRLLRLAHAADPSGMAATDREPAMEVEEPRYTTVDTQEAFEQLICLLESARQMVVDLETTSVHPRSADLVGIAVAVDPRHGWYVPVAAPAGARTLPAAQVIERLRPMLENESLEKVNQNIKYDMIVLRSHGIELAGVAFDPMVADYLLAPGERTHDLDDLARRYLQHDTIKITELIGKGKRQKRMDEVPVAEVTRYAGEDAVLPLRLRSILQQRLRDNQLETLFRQTEMPLIRVLAEMEYNGIRVDASRLETMARSFAERLVELEAEIHELAGGTFNIDSPKQLAEVLFERLGLPIVKRTKKSGPSTDVDVLETLAAIHPLPAKIVRYRQLAKLKGTYIDALPRLIHPLTGRVHTSFKQDVAATGRLSSKDPNLQNIPVRTEEGRAIRSAFLPAEGWQLLTADYSQIELRILAHYSGDAALLDAFARDEDIHTRVASEVFHVPLSEVTSDMRRRAKAVNFGIIYGQSAFGLAKGLGIGKEEAAEFIDAYFARYPGVEAFMEATLDACRRDGFVTTYLGRRRAIEGVRAASQRGDRRSRTLPERIAINTVIQGSAADVIKRAMIRVYERLRRQKLQTRMLLQIHDELVFEVPPEEHEDVVALVREEMTGAAQLRTPLKVDLKSGANWAECDDIPHDPSEDVTKASGSIDVASTNE